MTRPTPASASMPLAFAMIAALLIAVACSLPAHAYAEEAGADEPPIPKIVGSFDKDAYEPGDQAVVTFSVANNTPVTWNKVRLEAQLPQGVKLARDGEATAREADTLAAGETIELKLNVLFESSLFKRLAPTGDNGSAAGIALAAAAAAGFIALAAATFSRKQARSRRARGTMGALMSVVLVAGLAPLVPREAHADEASEQGAVTSFALEGSATCTAPGATVAATLTVGSTDQEAAFSQANVEVVDGAAASANAKRARINLVSSLPFADKPSIDAISLDGDFKNLSVTAVEHAGTATMLDGTEGSALAVTLEGDLGAPGARGVMIFGPGSFADAAASGEATLAVEGALITFDVDEGSYENSTFTFPVSLENGRFSAGAQAAHFAFSDRALSAASFTVDANDATRGTLAVTATADTPLNQFKALSAALDVDDQLTVDPAALDGEAPVAIAHPYYYDGDDVTEDAVSTADAAAAVPYGTVKAEGVTENKDGSLTVHSTVEFSALDGSVNITDSSLTNNSQITLPGQAPTLPPGYDTSESGDEGILEKNPGAVKFTEVRKNGFDFDFAIDAATVKSWYGAYTESGLTKEQANEQFLNEMTQLMCGHEVDLADGVVLNKLGIAQGPCAINLSDESLANIVGGTALYSQEDDMRTAKMVFEVLEKLVSAISYFCSSDPSNIGQGISQILGIIAALLETGPQYDIKDVLDELNQMKGQLTRMETSVDNLAIQLRAIDKRGGFESDWYQVKWLMDHLNSYGTLYTATIGSMTKEELANGGADAEVFEKLTKENQETLTNFKQAIDAKNGLLNTTVYADTVNLGSMITGTGTKDVVSDYYNWIETYYNWDPETFEIKDVYLGCMITSYLYGYMSSMAYLSTVEGTGTGPEKEAAAESKEYLKKQADQVLKKLVGQRERVWDQESMTYKEKFQKSPLRQATEPLANKKIRCLINEHVYSLDNHTGPLSGRMYDDAYFGNASFGKSVDREDVLMYSFTGDLNLAQWQQMEANLPQIRKIKYNQRPLHDYELNMSDASNIFSELRALGFTMLATRTSNTHTGDYPKGRPKPLVQWKSKEAPPAHVVVSDASYNKVSDQLAVRHVRTVSVDVYDIKTSRVMRGVTAARHESVYWVGYGWGYLHDVWPWCTSETKYENRGMV
ncbi:hypothetical protein [Paraeggerthella sp.]|uniref:hypothetical protein n=1 Tax=Paraeggerthella sp. TaxID=2897350 RepID=UPI003527AEB1